MDRLERRLEGVLREIGRTILQATLREIESEDIPARVHWSGQTFRRNRKTNKTIDTRFGQITLRRWFFQNSEPGEPGLAPLDVRLGLHAGRMTPALAEVVGRLSADLPQQAVLEALRERFGAAPGVGALRRIVRDLAEGVRGRHDQAAIDRLTQLLDTARQSEGKHEPLLQVGRDGVYVQTRPFWEEASCATLSVYDRSRRRLGTVYLGQMPECEQPTMTARLTGVITGVLTSLGGYAPKLRYVTDAGCHPQAYFHQVLKFMRHPLTGEPLAWSWGVDYYHACEYVSQLAAALFGGSSEAAAAWADKQRRTLKTKSGGVSRVIQSAAQQRRRHGLKAAQNYNSAINYLKKYRRYMDFAAGLRAGEPIGSGVTEAGCKVIFNQRLKQSGMRWRRDSGQHIVDLRTAVRGGLWESIWRRLPAPSTALPPISRQASIETKPHPAKPRLLS